VNQDRFVRCAAQFALASVVLATGEERQSEALALFEQFCAEFDGTHRYQYQHFEQVYHTRAKIELNDLRFHAVGQLAPDIVGIDLDDRPLKLSDYRGRVVLLSFWGTWCFPCMKLVPHERELVATHKGRPFDIVGVNCADEVEKAQAAAARTGMTWRSFRNEAGGQPAITKEWKILGFPTLYLIDHHGIIRKRWVGGPTPEEMGHMVKVLVEAAEKRIPQEEMKPVVAALAARPAATKQAPAAAGSVAPRPDAAFVDKVYRAADGLELKYTVFVPPGYDGSKTVPAILYLHGAGPRGTDGRAHLETGLAKAIRTRGLDFPFLVVFPQAREGEDWLADTTGGRRALAILAQVQADYRIDADRVALTGVSMGGAGTWSLAAADPKRWSAIVPICHGGDAATAAKLVGIPCWCFHGAADRVIPAQQSREMIDAITNAGGRPLYQEFPGVGHNDCAERAYAMNDLYEWLLMQNRSQR
jgi:poly(3-hydroxybutyrate) depolymerase/peroxiredoxin